MRYAETLTALLCSAAIATVGTGCASVTGRAPAAPQPGAAAPAAAAAPVVPAAVAAPSPPPVGAATQRAFDDAGRALRAGRVEAARRAYQALVQSNPELGGPHANLGIIARGAGKLAESATELEAAVRLSPQQPVYFNELGVTYRQQGKFDKARQAYEHAIALDANYAAPYLNLGILSDLYLGDGARALELYDRYLALSPGGDATVAKWVVEIKHRKAEPNATSQKEKV
jgi:Flp pilus assembly protein TadD